MRGDLVSAEVTLVRSRCRHVAAHVRNEDCGCVPEEVTAFVTGEVFCPNNDELDADVHSVAIDGERIALSVRETIAAEDALCSAWRDLFEKRAS